jgi:hypothetical protein
LEEERGGGREECEGEETAGVVNSQWLIEHADLILFLKYNEDSIRFAHFLSDLDWQKIIADHSPYQPSPCLEGPNGHLFIFIYLLLIN